MLEPKMRSEIINSKADIVKNDRTYNRWPREPMARGDTVSANIAELTCHCERSQGLPMRSNPKDCFDKKHLATMECNGLFAACPPSFWRSCLAGSSLTRGNPPTGFSESDVGRPPSVECDDGRSLDDLVSSELETTRLTDDEVRKNVCLTICSTWIQLCQN